MAKELTYKITTDSKQAVAGIKQFGTAVKKEMKGAEDALDDTRSAGKKAADAISAAADKMEGDLKSSKEAAEALATALGDTADKVDVSAVVADLRKMGLTFDEIRADADELADAIKRVDDVNVSGTGLKQVGEEADTSAGKVKHLGEESDQTKSVMANMAGNTAQDLGAVGGAAGSAGVAIGQLAEYATEGNISIGGLAKLAGPMAALAAVGAIVGEAFAGIKLEKEFNAERVTEMAEALRETGTAASYLREQFEETGKIEFVFDKGGFPGVGKEIRDITDDLGDLGLTFQQFDSAVRGGRLTIDNMAIGMKALRDAGGATEEQSLRVTQAMFKYQAQLDAAAAATELYNRVNRETPASASAAAAAFTAALAPAEGYTEQIATLAAGLKSGATDTEVFARALEVATEGMGLGAAEVLGLADAQNEAAASAEAAAREEADAAAAARKVADESKNAADAVAKHKQKWDELFGRLDRDDAIASVGESLGDLKQKGIEAFDATQKGAEDATAKQKAYSDQMRDSKRDVAEFATEVLGLPPEMVTNIIAKLDEGKVDEVNAFIYNLSLGAELPVDIQMKLPPGWKVNADGKIHGPGGITVQSVPIGPSVTPHATPAAPVAPVAVPAVHATATATPLLAGATFNVTVNTRATDGRGTARALERWYRVNGARPRGR